LGSQSLANRVMLFHHAVFLVTSPERSVAKFSDEETECDQRPTVGRYGVVVEVAFDDLSQPFPLDRDRLPVLPQFLFDDLQLCPHAIAEFSS
jgi:hypothetical protein